MDHTALNDGQHPNKDLLTTLPNELLIHITELLPVREICRLRGLNRHLRSFIDTNEHLLVKGVIKYHRDRIHTEHRLLTDPSGCDTFDIVRRFHSHYGLRWLQWTIQNPVLTKAVEPYTQPLPLYIAPDVLRIFFDLLEAETGDHDILCFDLAIMGTRTYHLPNQRVETCVVNFNLFFHQVQQVLPDPILLELLELGKKLLCTPPERCITGKSSVAVLTRRIVAGRIAYEGAYNSERALFHTILGLPVLDASDYLAFAARIKVRPGTSLLDRIASSASPMLRQAYFLQEIFFW
jgi:hypothetical protein